MCVCGGAGWDWEWQGTKQGSRKMERKREKLGVGQLWGLQRALRGIGWVSCCPGVPCLRPSSQAITPTELALAQCPAASRQSLSLPAHKSELLTSGSVASPSSRGISACVWQPPSIFWGKCRGSLWSLALPPPLQRWEPPWLLSHHQEAKAGSPPGSPPALQPPGQRTHPSSPTVMKSSLCQVPCRVWGQHFHSLSSALCSGQ